MRDLESELMKAIGEEDPERPLDSLEAMVLHTRLVEHGYPEVPYTMRPNTLKEWFRWAAEHSPDS
ncbi:hypothetical protein [Kocuria sp. CPCC 205297]|uniref:hypothetical protein n=1 Tax=Kocuria sp. CPCC 205297 TaxID=3073558 RepID=UPI0034D3B6CE